MKNSRIYHQNAVRFIRRNRPKEVSRKPPLPKVKAGWRMPQYPEVYCFYCEERMRPMAHNIDGAIGLVIGCGCNTLIYSIEWPFVDEYTHRTREALERLGFEYNWG